MKGSPEVVPLLTSDLLLALRKTLYLQPYNYHPKMKKYNYTPGEDMNMYGSHPRTSVLPFSVIPCPVLRLVPYILFISFALVFFLWPTVTWSKENTPFFIHEISINDTAVLNRSTTDSLLSRQDLLEFPPIHELEVQVGSAGNKQLEYQLAGFDENWNSNHYHTIRYTSLPDGTYQLLVRVADSDHPPQQLFSFSVQAKPTDISEEWWFQPILTFCLLLIPFTVTYFLALDRSRRNLRLEVVRNQIASDLHDAVGANLSAINNFIELLIRKQNAKQSDMLARLTAKIKKITVDTISNLQDTVWAINPLNDSIEELLVRMKDFAILMLGTKEIRMIYDNHYDPKKPVKLDMQQRHAMYMMFKEMINNIVKYSNATEVNIQISNDHSGLFIEVKDNGIGFDPNAPQKGNGLRNFRNRAKENFIDLDLKTAPGAGVQTQMMVHSLA